LKEDPIYRFTIHYTILLHCIESNVIELLE